MKRALLLFTLTLSGLAIEVAAQKRIRYDRELQAFFKDVDANYPFFKVKGITKEWKALKKALLKRAKKCKTEADFIAIAGDAVRGMRDGHASFTDIRPKLKRSEPEFYPGVVFMRATEGRVVVAASANAVASKVPRGAIIEKIDGKNAREYLDAVGAKAWAEGGHFSSPQRATFFAYRLPLSGKRNTKHTVVVTTAKKKKRKVTLRANVEVRGWLHLYNPPENLARAERSVYHARLADGTGYVWLRRMDQTAEAGVRKAIEAHKDAERWIVDLRGNTGGGYSSSFKKTIGQLGKRVAAIIDAGSVSAAETFTRDLVNVCKARVFGAKSAGSSSSKKVFKFPSGIASIRYSVRSRSGVGGKPIEFHGITPDVLVEADPAQVAAGKNTEIEAALAWLNGKQKR